MMLILGVHISLPLYCASAHTPSTLCDIPWVGVLAEVILRKQLACSGLP